MMLARLTSKCRRCGDTIYRGDPIGKWIRRFGGKAVYVHAKCASTPDGPPTFDSPELDEEFVAAVEDKPCSRPDELKAHKQLEESILGQVTVMINEANAPATLDSNQLKQMVAEYIQVNQDTLFEKRVVVEIRKPTGKPELLDKEHYHPMFGKVCKLAAMRKPIFMDSDKTHFIAARLKKADMPLNMASLVAAVSGWAYRTLWFAATYLEKYKVNWGLGQAKEPTVELCKQITKGDKLMYVKGVFSYDDAVVAIKEWIAGTDDNAKGA